MSIIDEQMTAKRQHKRIYHIGLVDADLLCNGTRHPNLALLKIAGYLRDNGFVRKNPEIESAKVNTYELLTNESNFEMLQDLDLVYVSCVFSFTLDKPPVLLRTPLIPQHYNLTLFISS